MPAGFFNLPTFGLPSFPMEMSADAPLGAALDIAAIAATLERPRQRMAFQQPYARFSEAQVGEEFSCFRYGLDRFLEESDAAADVERLDSLKDEFTIFSRDFFDERLRNLGAEILRADSGKKSRTMHPIFTPKGLFMLMDLEVVSHGAVAELARACSTMYDGLCWRNKMYHGAVVGLVFMLSTSIHAVIGGRLPHPSSMIALGGLMSVAGVGLSWNSSQPFSRRRDEYEELASVQDIVFSDPK